MAESTSSMADSAERMQTDDLAERGSELLEQGRELVDTLQTVIDGAGSVLDELATRIDEVNAESNPNNGDGTSHSGEDLVVQIGSARVHLRRFEIENDSQRVQLTPTEGRLLDHFIKYPDKPLSRAELAEGAWGEAFVGRPNEVDVYVARLRKKLRRAVPEDIEIIATVRGVGYFLRAESLSGSGNGETSPLLPLHRNSSS
jgi:DNA-binding response OmpR family regulator